MHNKFYITTPIYYVNGLPHIGHFYTSLIADTIARFHKIRGSQVRLTTGVDENSQKAILIAQEKNMPIMSYLDEMAFKHQKVWDDLDICYTDFIRTTEARHHTLVRDVLQKTYDKGDIYEGYYEGMYCVGCEAFKKEDDLIEKDGKKVCPDHLKQPDYIKEKNYFFRLSKYADQLLDFYEKNPEFVIPNDRFNEVKAFVKRGLDDFSISRETNTFGIKLPFDEGQVTYVWFDALYNYVTSCMYSRGGDKNFIPNEIAGFKDERSFWPADLHVMGKDIIRFHAIYWPAMLMSVGLELPKQILANGFFTVDGQKMSKSLGNVLDPVEYTKTFPKEGLILYLLSNFTIGQDGDFDQKQALFTYNAKFANNLGNLVNRVIVLTLKLPEENPLGKNDVIDTNILKFLTSYQDAYLLGFQRYDLKEMLDKTFQFLDELNKYVDMMQPWQMIKNAELEDETKKVLYTVAESLRQVGLNLYPFFSDKMEQMFQKFGLQGYAQILETGGYEVLKQKKEIFHICEKGENLFERLEVEGNVKI